MIREKAMPVKTFEAMYLRGLRGSCFGLVNVFGSERALAGSIHAIKVKKRTES
jgi:hypothetical protein